MSLLIREGASIVEIARQAGHAPTMTLKTLRIRLRELEASDRVSVETEIRRAREEVRVRFVSGATDQALRRRKKRLRKASPVSDSNR